ncbi:exodeoxyribonuclease V subunit alpha [Vibrio crassostreae]|uniref:exodeoxyribonuclease V subunit alpha n=1 Tax=Vibrio crassostreae TaxID=246167 RepID=UPI001B3074C5|nr:exodeoxyribonuclease V subunit alpha [Vibrio crassostreae]
MLKILNSMLEQEVIKDIDYFFAVTVAEQSEKKDSKEENDALAFTAALLSHELQKGNVCINPTLSEKTRVFGLNAEQYSTVFAKKVSEYLDTATKSAAVSTGATTPLIFDKGLFYLNKYWGFEQLVAKAFSESDNQDIGSISDVKEMLDELFPRPYEILFSKITDNPTFYTVEDVLGVVDTTGIDTPFIESKLKSVKSAEDLRFLDTAIPEDKCLNWQKIAVAVALMKKNSVISGGPGTGKTTTVCKLLAALIAQKQLNNEELEIKLVAPTGKAAARLTESIGNTISTLPIDQAIKDRIPTKSSTIHRLLGAVHGRSNYRFNKNNLLHLDVLVVDEASMVDLPMMAKIIEALPPHAKLILLGDKDQLASVEAGSVLGDICSFSNEGYSESFASTLSNLTGYKLSGKHNNEGVTDALCVLQKSYRFHKDSGIGKLAASINHGSPSKMKGWFEKDFEDIEYNELSPETYSKMIRAVSKSYKPFLTEILNQGEPKSVLDLFLDSRLLCALREGDFGVTGLNGKIEKTLASQKLLTLPENGIWYEGRPIMITRNDYGMGLYNGDIGITMRSKEDGSLKVFFEMPDGEIKGFLTCRIPDHETAFAMTIHKSQGSEFNKTFMVLPTDFSPIITRELVYTGVTRAKKFLSLYTKDTTLDMGVKLKTERASGLAEELCNR